ncbi:uncharacterized protein LOC134249123 isoform X2 [Saccostrea cucullata]|uniref:uncharacterized protein LOC134249123 isoform X2 n=1 Tax=Saccostrea cuccullata TaxID=36930 RepID=UPI002ED5C198
MAYMKNGKTTVRHARGIVVGCAGAGKTTLLYRLMGKSLDEIKEIKSTRGLHVYEHLFLVKNEDLIASEDYVLKKRLIRVPISALKQNINVDLLHAFNERKIQISASLRSAQNDTLAGNEFGKNPSTLHNLSLDNDANYTQLTQDLMKEVLDARENEISVSIMDFAGQFAYYACHQIYMRSEAFYVLVMDMSKAFHDVINSTTDQHQERSIFNTWSYKDYLHFWLDSIKSFGGTSAQVFAVATHAEGKNEKDCFWESLWTLVSENDKTWLQKCIGEKEFALGLIEMNEQGTFSLQSLKNAIVEVVSKYMDTKIEVPSAWALLEHLLKKTEKPILSVSDINRENEKLPEEYQLKSQEEILDFLSFFHGHGLLLFFKEDELSSHAILGIQWFSNAFSKLIADKEHINRDCKRRYIKEWNNFNATGNLPNSLVDALWKEEPTYAQYKTELMSYMERLRMLVRIDRTEDDISWYVPCMNKKCFTHDVFERKLEKSSVLCFRFTSFAMFMYYRLIAYCMSFLKWGVPSDKKGSQCLYHTAAIFETLNHTVVVGISDNDIQVQVLRSNNLHPEVSCEIGQAIEITLSQLTKTFDEKKNFQKGYKCLNIFCSKGDTTFIPENNVYEIKDSVIQCNCPIGKRHDIDVPWTLGFWKKAKENDMELSQNLNANHVVESTLSAKESKKRNWEMFEKLTEISRDVLQIYFDNNIPPQDLEKVLTTYKDDMKKGPYRFGEEQLRVLFPGDGSCVTSSSFDITMMYKLLRNYQGKDLPGWGKKPETEDINEVNDVERIRWYRNKIYHAVSETKVLEKDVFEKYWLDLSQAIERLSKGEYRAAIEELKLQI